MINDLYVNGQGQDVWSRSNQIIKEAAFYSASQVYDDVKIDSCLALNLNTKFYFEVIQDHRCDPTSVLLYNYCMCSD
jgi:hypothetical protein